jgi:hypothetical protein
MQTTIKEIDIKDLEIETELDCDSVIIQLYKVPYKHRCNRNIVGENKKGEMIWQVEEVNPLETSDFPFLSIRPFNKEKIIAYNWLGMDYYIDIQTGKLDLVNKNARPW